MVMKSFIGISLLILLVECNNNDKTSFSPGNESALKQLKLSVQNNPDSLQLLEKLIQYYRDNGSYDTALSLTDNAIKRDSQAVELWDIKATLLYENEDTLESIKAFEHAISMYPLPEYLISLGQIYAQTKNPKALAMANALIIGNKAKAEKEAMFIKGLYYTYSGDKRKALVFFDSCISLDYTYMYAYREKAVALYDMGKYDDAVKVLSRAVTIQNNFDEGYYWMGMCFEKLNRQQDAIEQYQIALRYDRDFVEAKEALKRLGVK